MLQNLEQLSWNQLVQELRELMANVPSPSTKKEDSNAVLHELLVHQVELEMQNRELRDAQQRLEASRALYADLYDFAPVGCLTIDGDERITEINLTGGALLGRDRADIIGRPFLAVVTLGDRATLLHEHVRRCMTERCRVDTEIELLRKGRAPLLLLMTSVPMLDGEGKAIACRTALTDLTDRRRADTAEASARIKETFLGTVSHELRTPLSAIVGWVSVLQAQAARDPEVNRPMLERGLEIIARNAWAQNRIIEDILDVSRILEGKLRVDLQPTDLGPLVEVSVETLRPLSLSKKIALSSDAPSGAIVLGDAERLTQILTNLLNNALKFTPEGGSVRVSVRDEGDTVVMAVEDDGRGIEPADLKRVFERFSQIDSSTTRTAPGLGLGLSIVDHLVRAHGGDVVARSRGLGQGATFEVRLRKPRGEEAVTVTPSAPWSAAPLAGAQNALEGHRILCVDDDVDALEVMALFLRHEGATVSTATSAAEALAAVMSAAPDVVVSDIGLPNEDGYSLVQAIRALPTPAANVPAIAVTGYAGPMTERRATEAGFRHVLRKPVEPEVLIALVATVVAKHRATQAPSA